MKLNRIILCSVFLIPLNKKENWQELKYSKINPHVIEFAEAGMKIKVNSSAMPLIYPLSKVHQLKSISIAGEYKGKLNLNKKIKQGDKGNDDSIFRFGLVVPGEKTLPFYKRPFAPGWIKKLFDLAPKDSGVDRIEFYNVYEDQRLKGQSRIHPLGNGLINENNIWDLSKAGKFKLAHKFESPVPAAAIWISIDGDDTKSEYEIWLNKIELME
ncbi:hypothetical protein N9W41_00745 [bacterium]|nr:hypothetical protein [bacterium]